jgi:hypothetical protein
LWTERNYTRASRISSGEEPNYFSITAKVEEEEERSGTHVHTPGEMNRSGKTTSGWNPKIDRIIDRERD